MAAGQILRNRAGMLCISVFLLGAMAWQSLELNVNAEMIEYKGKHGCTDKVVGCFMGSLLHQD